MKTDVSRKFSEEYASETAHMPVTPSMTVEEDAARYPGVLGRTPRSFRKGQKQHGSCVNTKVRLWTLNVLQWSLNDRLRMLNILRVECVLVARHAANMWDFYNTFLHEGVAWRYMPSVGRSTGQHKPMPQSEKGGVF